MQFSFALLQCLGCVLVGMYCSTCPRKTIGVNICSWDLQQAASWVKVLHNVWGVGFVYSVIGHHFFRLCDAWFDKAQNRRESPFENTAGSEHKNKFFVLDNRMKKERTHNMGLEIAGGRCLADEFCLSTRLREAAGRYPQCLTDMLSGQV